MYIHVYTCACVRDNREREREGEEGGVRESERE